MKRFIGIMFLLTSSVSYADHLDVISFTLKDGCSYSEMNETVAEFNGWASDMGYQAEIASPMFHDDMNTRYWIGRSAGNEAFGKAYDSWFSGLVDEDSNVASLSERMNDCMDFGARRAYMTSP